MTGDRPLILIADPDVDVLASLSGFLEKEGHRTTVTRWGNEALAVVADHSPEIVFLSLALTDVDGLDLVETIKRLSPQTRVIALADDPRLHTFAEVLGAGGEDLLPRQCEKEEILFTVDRIIHREIWRNAISR